MSLREVVLFLCLLESNNNPDAVGDTHLGDNCARGILQIRPCVVQDVNRKYGTSYKKTDCYNIEISKDICEKYLLMWCGPNADFETYVRTWNGGPKGAQRKTTLKYFTRCTSLLQKEWIPNRSTYFRKWGIA